MVYVCILFFGKCTSNITSCVVFLGKKFKLEVWETCVKSMRVGEVASFTVQPAVNDVMQ